MIFKSALIVLESTLHYRGVDSSIVGVSSNAVALKTYSLYFSMGVGSSTVAVCHFFYFLYESQLETVAA